MDKQSLRERVWDDLEDSGVARFPFPPHDRIPNFAGAEDAADRLAATDAWERADAIKANPDAPQLPVRRRALREGKTVFVAVPRLADDQPFRALDPAEIDPDGIDDATTVSGIDEYGRPVGPESMPHVDLIVSGSVAVGQSHGARIGKGEGYSDLEYAMLAEFGLVDADTTVATTVHERQVFEETLPVSEHDVRMDVLVTPERTLWIGDDGGGGGQARQPSGIDWDALDEERLAEIPVLERLRPE